MAAKDAATKSMSCRGRVTGAIPGAGHEAQWQLRQSAPIGKYHARIAFAVCTRPERSQPHPGRTRAPQEPPDSQVYFCHAEGFATAGLDLHRGLFPVWPPRYSNIASERLFRQRRFLQVLARPRPPLRSAPGVMPNPPSNEPFRGARSASQSHGLLRLRRPAIS
jgi:hypothetical protein